MTAIRADGLTSLFAAALLVPSCIPPSIGPNAAPRLVTLRVSVVDSLTFAPLRNARVTLSGTDTVVATTDSLGGFVVSLRSGVWRAEVSHARSTRFA